MINLLETSEYRSMQASGVSFGRQAETMLGKKGVNENDFTTLELNDVVVFPQKSVFGFSKQFGGFALVWLLKGGNTNDARPFRLYPGTIDPFIDPVERNEEGIYERVGVRPLPRNYGDVITFIKGSGTYLEAFKGLEGKAFKVKSETEYKVFKFGSTTEVRDRNQQELEFVKVDDKLKAYVESVKLPEKA